MVRSRAGLRLAQHTRAASLAATACSPCTKPCLLALLLLALAPCLPAAAAWDPKRCRWPLASPLSPSPGARRQGQQCVGQAGGGDDEGGVGAAGRAAAGGDCKGGRSTHSAVQRSLTQCSKPAAQQGMAQPQPPLRFIGGSSTGSAPCPSSLPALPGAARGAAAATVPVSLARPRRWCPLVLLRRPSWWALWRSPSSSRMTT